MVLMSDGARVKECERDEEKLLLTYPEKYWPSCFLVSTQSEFSSFINLPLEGASPTGTQTLLCKQSSSHALSSKAFPAPGCGQTPQPPVKRAGFLFVPYR
jgi:hypothetical protein